MRIFSSFSIFFIGMLLAGCNVLYDPFSGDNIHKTVQPHPNRKGIYIVHFNVKKVVNEFGPGMNKLHQEIEKSESSEEEYAYWRAIVESSLIKYLQIKQLVPVECSRGVVIVSSGKDEIGGGGAAAFRCR